MNKSKFNRKFKNNRKIYNVRYNRYRSFSNMSAPMKTAPTSFGPGTYVSNISKLVSGSLNTQILLMLYSDIIDGNPEFFRVNTEFKYFKVLGLSVIFLPRNLPIDTNLDPAYLMVNYDGNATKNFRLQDSVKIIPVFISRPKVYKFYMPKIAAYTGTLDSFMPMNSITNLNQVLIQMQAPGNTTQWRFRVEIRLLFKGPTTESEPSAKAYFATTDMFAIKEDPGDAKECKEEQLNDEEENNEATSP